MRTEFYRKIASGNIRAENTLYLQAFNINRNFVLKNWGNIQDVEDNYHQGLIIFIEKLRNRILAPENASNKYLFGICRNLWLKELKRRKKNERVVTNLPIEEYISDEVDERFGTYYSSILQTAFDDMEKSGDERQHLCLESIKSRYLAQMEYSEMAVLNKCSIDGVRQRVSRCMQQLRKKCKDLEKIRKI